MNIEDTLRILRHNGIEPLHLTAKRIAVRETKILGKCGYDDNNDKFQKFCKSNSHNEDAIFYLQNFTIVVPQIVR